MSSPVLTGTLILMTILLVAGVFVVGALLVVWLRRGRFAIDRGGGQTPVSDAWQEAGRRAEVPDQGTSTD